MKAATPKEPDDQEAVAAPAPPPLLTLRDGLPGLVDDPAELERTAERIAAGTGPIALDAERASGYRYSARAYLIQVRREGSGTALVDPVALDDLAPLVEAFGDAEWILHAASQDLPCLRELGLRPSRLFDTELAARLLGYPRVGLATLVESIVGRSMRKEHSAADWSRRPLPTPWLEYAALDVEVLLELRAALAEQLEETGKANWAAEEFTELLDFEPRRRSDPWRRTSGIHKVRGRRHLAAVRELWQARDGLAAERDVTPGRLVPDSALVAAARAMPTSRSGLMATEGFHGRGARRYADRWLEAVETARKLPESELPPVNQPGDGPPQARAWAERDPVAAARLASAREAVAELSEQLDVPQENLLTPDSLRRVLWSPPTVDEPEQMRPAVEQALFGLGARHWQVELTAGLISEAILHPGPPAGDSQ